MSRFTDLPRNTSQALELASLSYQKLGKIWGNIIKNVAHHQITVNCIRREINPNAVSKANLSLPIYLGEQIRDRAFELGLSVPEYLKRLVNGEELEPERAVESVGEVSEEDAKTLDQLDLKFRSIEIFATIAHFDRMISNSTATIAIRHTLAQIVAHLQQAIFRIDSNSLVRAA